MFFGTRFFRSKKEDKVGTNNLVRGFKEILEDEENEILEEESISEKEMGCESLLRTIEEIVDRGTLLEGWEVHPGAHPDENTETGVFIYNHDFHFEGKDDYFEMKIGWSMDFTWPNQYERPFIEWLSVSGGVLYGEHYVFGDAVKYCISEELLSIVEKLWKERINSLDSSFNNWFEDYRNRCRERGWIK